MKKHHEFNKVFISVGGIPEKDINLLVNELLVNHSKRYALFGFQAEPTHGAEPLLKLKSFKNDIQTFNWASWIIPMEEANAFHLSLLAMGMGITVIEKHLTWTEH